MKRVLFFLGLVILILLVFLVQKQEEAVLKNTSREIQVSLSIDEESYQQGEKVSLNVSVFSQGQLENVSIVLSGIQTRFGRDYINLEKTINLKPGENLVEFSFNMPYCSSCSGVSPGKHEILVKVVYGNETIGLANKTIELK